MSSFIKNYIKEKYRYNEEQIYFLCGGDKAYKSITINKHNGQTRLIRVPCKELMKVQREVLEILKKKIKDTKYLKHQYAYRKGKNNIEYARVHLHRKYLFKYDLKNYFDQITFPRIIGTLTKNNIYEDDAIFIAQLSCYRINNKHIALAQGGPLSPFLLFRHNIFLCLSFF